MPYSFFNFFSSDNETPAPIDLGYPLIFISFRTGDDAISENVLYVESISADSDALRYTIRHKGVLHEGELYPTDLGVTTFGMGDLGGKLMPRLLHLLYQRGHIVLQANDLFGWLGADWQRVITQVSTNDVEINVQSFEVYLKLHLEQLCYVLYRELEYLYGEGLDTILRFSYVGKRKAILSEYFDIEESPHLKVCGIKAEHMPTQTEHVGHELLAITRVLGRLADRLDKEKTDDAWFGERASVLASRLRQVCQRLLTDTTRLLMDYRGCVMHSRTEIEQQLQMIVDDLGTTAVLQEDMSEGLTELERLTRRAVGLHRQQRELELTAKAAKEEEAQALRQQVETLQAAAITQHRDMEAIAASKASLEEMLDAFWSERHVEGEQQSRLIQSFDAFIHSQRNRIQQLDASLTTFAAACRTDAVDTLYDLSMRRRDGETLDERFTSESEHAQARLEHAETFIDTMANGFNAIKRDIQQATTTLQRLRQQNPHNQPNTKWVEMREMLGELDEQLNVAFQHNRDIRQQLSDVRFHVVRDLKRATALAEALAVNATEQDATLQQQAETIAQTQTTLAQTSAIHQSLTTRVETTTQLVSQLGTRWSMSMDIITPLINRQVARLREITSNGKPSKADVDKLNALETAWRTVCEELQEQPDGFVNLKPVADALAIERHPMGNIMRFFGHKAKALTTVEDAIKAMARHGQEPRIADALMTKIAAPAA